MAVYMNAQLKHEEYLIRLGKRNKYLKARSETNCEEEKKPSFSIYINGENRPKSKSNLSNCKSARTQKPLKQGFIENYAIRSKTAPENDKRRFWGQGTVTIKTDRGEKIHLSHKEPSCDYSDDFEEDLNQTGNTYSSGSSHTNSSQSITFEEVKTYSDSDNFSDSLEDNFDLSNEEIMEEILENKSLKNSTDVKLLLQTSWNSLNQLGLTEIQLYDIEGRKVDINYDLITVSGISDISGDISYLVNHRFKTTKEKNMVVFTKSNTTVPVTIKFAVPYDINVLSKMLIWNYNKSIDSLSIGTKYCEVFLNKKCIFKGDLEKGCGNQVFDYAHVINLSQYLNSTKNTIDKKSGQISSGLLQLANNSTGKPSVSTGVKQKKTDEKTTRNRNNILEQSWNSLNLFNHTQFGSLLSASRAKNMLSETLSENVPNEGADCINIPQLPCGKHIEINITSTWGDLHYVGLNGIEFYSETGSLIEVDKITANPPDINILPKTSNDPRIVTNLIDGINNTNDDLHMWLTPFTPNQSHLINISFGKSTKVAMARIWNYNKSRIHAIRGVRQITIKLDNLMIFNGEIARASGSINQNLETFGDTILFTLDDNILENVSKHDDQYFDMECDIEL